MEGLRNVSDEEFNLTLNEKKKFKVSIQQLNQGSLTWRSAPSHDTIVLELRKDNVGHVQILRPYCEIAAYFSIKGCIYFYNLPIVKWLVS